MKAKCLHPYNAADQTQVSFGAGEELVIMDNPAGEWVWVRNTRGQEGYAPVSFLQLPPPGQNGYIGEEKTELSNLDTYVGDQPIDTGPQYKNADEEIAALRAEGWLFLEDDGGSRIFCYNPATDCYKFPKIAKRPPPRVDASNSSSSNANIMPVMKPVQQPQQVAQQVNRQQQGPISPPTMLSGNAPPPAQRANTNPTPPTRLNPNAVANTPPPPAAAKSNPNPPPPPAATNSNAPPPPPKPPGVSSSSNTPQPPPPKSSGVSNSNASQPPPPTRQAQPMPPPPQGNRGPPPSSDSTMSVNLSGGAMMMNNNIISMASVPPRPTLTSPPLQIGALQPQPSITRPAGLMSQMSLLNLGRESNLSSGPSMSSFSEGDMMNFVNSVRAADTDAIITECYLKQKKGVFSGYLTAAEMGGWALRLPKTHLLEKTQPMSSPRVLQVFADICDYTGDSYLAAGGADGGSKSQRVLAKIGQYETLCSITSHGEGNNDVRDEEFVFLIRQTTRNPSDESVMRGWELIASCASVFVPSNERILLLLRKHADINRSRPDEIGGLAIRVWQRLVPGICGGPPDRVTSEGLALIKRTFMPVSVFGASLEGVLRKEAFGDNPFCTVSRQLLVREYRVPLVLKLLTSCVLRLNGAQCEGIFRITGGSDNAKQTRSEMADGRYDVLFNTLQLSPSAPIRRSGNQSSSKPPSSYQIHDAIEAADVLKQWLRSLTEPLIPYAAYDACLAAGRMGSVAKCVDIMNNVNIIPEANKACLLFLFGFLTEIARNSQMNKMDTSNLALVMSPNLMRGERDTAESFARNSDNEKRFIQFLLDAVVATSNGSNLNGIQLQVSEFWNQQAMQF